MNEKIAELRLLVRSSPKKAGLLGVLVLVLAGVGTKQMIGGAPRSASASSDTGAVDAVRTEVLGLSDIEDLIDERPSVEVTINGGRMRDLFRFDDRLFPAPAIERGDEGRSAKSDTRMDDPPDVPADPVALERARVRDEAERFRLTSTLLGAESLAVLDFEDEDGRARTFMLRIGESFRGFELVSVSHRSAQIVNNGQEFTLHVDD